MSAAGERGPLAGLDEVGWDHRPPAPELPEEVVANTRARYLDAHERITGQPLPQTS